MGIAFCNNGNRTENLGLAQLAVRIALNKLRRHFGDMLSNRSSKCGKWLRICLWRDAFCPCRIGGDYYLW
jgi:hypothetical protein